MLLLGEMVGSRKSRYPVPVAVMGKMDAGTAVAATTGCD